jgi:hypothetical protein
MQEAGIKTHKAFDCANQPSIVKVAWPQGQWPAAYRFLKAQDHERHQGPLAMQVRSKKPAEVAKAWVDANSPSEPWVEAAMQRLRFEPKQPAYRSSPPLDGLDGEGMEDGGPLARVSRAWSPALGKQYKRSRAPGRPHSCRHEYGGASEIVSDIIRRRRAGGRDHGHYTTASPRVPTRDGERGDRRFR